MREILCLVSVRCFWRRFTSNKDNFTETLNTSCNDPLRSLLNPENLKKRLKEPMDPDTKFRRSWDFLMMLMVVFQALYIPYSVAWQYSLGEDWDFDLVVDCLFIFDLIMNFNLAYRPHPQADLITDRKKIGKDGRGMRRGVATEREQTRKLTTPINSVVASLRSAPLPPSAYNYFKLWFWIDLPASLPFDRIAESLSSGKATNDGAGALGLLKGLKIPRLLRLLKIMR